MPEATEEAPEPEPEVEVEFHDEDSERRYLTLQDLASPEDTAWPPHIEPPAGETPFFTDYDAERPLGTWTWDDIEGVQLGLPDLTDLDAASPGPPSGDEELPATEEHTTGPLTEDEVSWMETGELAIAAELEHERLRSENERLLSDREHLRARQNVFLLAGSLVGLALGLVLGAWLI